MGLLLSLPTLSKIPFLQIFGSLFALGYPPIQILLVGAYIVSSYFAIVEKQFGKLGQVKEVPVGSSNLILKAVEKMT